MPSRAELRVSGERVLRGSVIAILAMMLWQSLHQQPSQRGTEIHARGLSDLPKWSSASAAPHSIQVQLDSVPTPLEREWLKALKGAGSLISWTGDLPAMMIAAQPVASPAGGLRVRIAAPAGAMVELRDEVGVIDTVRAENAGASFLMSSAVGNLAARVNRSVATTMTRDSVALRKVLVIANAGWESKFVTAALEENGWKVDAFIRVAPAIDVTQGSAAVIDTSRYSAVVALDNAAAPYAARIAEFVRTGGGLVMGPDAAALDALAPLRSGSVGNATAPARTAELSGSVSRGTLALAPVVALRADAVPIESRSDAVAVAARRIGAGRALQFGYEDTWRWRMGGGESSLRDHRIWWTGLVSSVAYARHIVAHPDGAADDAPVAQLVAAIGPGNAGAAVANAALVSSHWTVWLFAFLSLALMAEVASRRLRSAG